jgi:hypothetical protein
MVTSDSFRQCRVWQLELLKPWSKACLVWKYAVNISANTFEVFCNFTVTNLVTVDVRKFWVKSDKCNVGRICI